MASIPSSDRFYVYTLSFPCAYAPVSSSRNIIDGIFYVDKGSGDRIDCHEEEARKGVKSHKCNVIRQIWHFGGEVRKNIVFRTPSEQAAFNYEARLIAMIGLPNLTNIDPGGGLARKTHHIRYSDEGGIRLDDYSYIIRLRNIRGMTEKEIKRLLTERRYARLGETKREVSKARRYGSWPEDYIQKLEREVESLRAALGLVVQLPIPNL